MVWILVLSLVGLFVVVNVFLAYFPPYQRWFQREEARQRQLTLEAKRRADAAISEALLAIATQARLRELPPLEKPRVRLVPRVTRVHPEPPAGGKELKMFRFWCVVLSLVVVYALVAHGYGLFVLMGTIFAAIAGLSLAGIYGMSAWMRRADAPRKPPRWYSYPDPHVHRLDP